MINRNSGILGILILTIIAAELAAAGTLGSSHSASADSSLNVQPLITSTPLTLNITLAGGGATFPQPLIANWTIMYHRMHPNVTLTYQSVGSGKGQAFLLNKTVDFGASDAPLSTRQRSLYPGVLHIPESIGSVTASYNLPGIARGSLLLTGSVIANIYLGQITMWNDPQITALNPTLTLPAQPILVAHRSDSSGTTFVWTNFLCLDSVSWCSTVGKGTVVSWPTGVGASGNGGLANYVNSTTYSIGYVELQYAVGHGLTYAKVQNPAGTFVQPTEQTTAWAVANSTSTLPTSQGDWSAVSMLNAGGSNTYPIASFTYFLVYKEMNVVPSMDLVDRIQFQALKDFLNWAVTIGQNYASANNYVPLPAGVVSIDQTGINSMTYTEVSAPISRNISLSLGASGWNGTNPGPGITIASGDQVTINFASTDGLAHQWYIDFNNNGIQDANETYISFAFNTAGPSPYPFTPIIWNQESVPAAGTYTYRDANNPSLTGSITILPQQTAAVLKSPATDLNSALLPAVDSSRVDTIGTLIVDLRTNTVQGNVTVVAADKGTSSITYAHGYLLSGLRLVTVPGQSGLQLRFIVNVAVLPYALSSNILVQLQGSIATTSRSLTRELDINSDGTINILDVGIVLNAYGFTKGQSSYNALADLNGDGTINILDMGPLLANYGQQAFH